MSETTPLSASVPEPSKGFNSGLPRPLWLVLPVLLLAVASMWLLSSDLFRSLERGAPPVEKLTF